MPHRVPGFSRFFLVLALLIFAVAQPGAASADTLTVQNPGTGSVHIDGKWQFKLGDNLAWADPAFDDSGWEQISADSTWGSQTHPSYTGFAWYRRHITIDSSDPSGTKNLAVLIPPVDDAYDLYWNGKKIGSYGGLPPLALWWLTGHNAVYSLPASAESGVLALRVWKAPLSTIDLATNGGFESTPLLGDPSVLSDQSQLPYYQNDETELPRNLISAVVLIAGILSFVLFLRDCGQGLFLWLALYLVADGLYGLEHLSAPTFGLTYRQIQLAIQLLECFQDISMWMILLHLFGMADLPRWKRITAWIIAIYLAAQVIDVATIFLWANPWSALPWIDAISTAVYTTTPLYIFVIVIAGLEYRKQVALWPLIAAACLSGLYSWLYQLSGQFERYTHSNFHERLAGIGFHAGSSFFGLVFIFNVILFLALVFTIARESFLERERQNRIELEIKSAQEVQKILVPEDTPAIPGFAISSIYRPAEEVGGDFFQVIPTAHGGALVILGDVSGKGLKAAMTVSLIIGTLRTLADYSQSPAQILNGLNRRLIGRTDDGFATCLIARIDADGSVALANAGHLAPFRNHEELPVSGSAPLGLIPDADYEELVFRLHEDDTLLLYTDGVVEARNEAGELYGFDRVALLAASVSSVDEVVDAARSFGQRDDITVIRVTRLAESAPAHAARLDLATQIAGA